MARRRAAEDQGEVAGAVEGLAEEGGHADRDGGGADSAGGGDGFAALASGADAAKDDGAIVAAQTH